MCLAVPGKISQIEYEQVGFPVGTVDFGGLTMEVGLAFVPNAAVGDYVIVHAGYAIGVIDEHEAEETLSLLRQMAEVGGANGDCLPDSLSPAVSNGKR